MKQNDVKKMYIEPLTTMNIENIRVIEEQGCVTDIIIGHDEENFFLSFVYEGRVDICWENELFIFDRGRNLLTSEDTYGEIVYENMEKLVDSKMMAETILKFIGILYGRKLIKKQEIETCERTTLGYDKKKDYFIFVSGENDKSERWKFANIEIISE